MSNKEALRDFQLRLAGRLQAARDQPREAGWLAVQCAGLGLLLPLAQAGEIHALRQIAPVPHTRPWLSGVANLRGQLHAVIDFGAFLQLRAPVPPAGESATERVTRQLVALNPSLRLNAALLVDRLIGLRDSEQLTPLADDGAAAGRPAFAGARWRDAQGGTWLALDLAALALDPQFLDVAA
ncbi:MAG TPA: chemotaxis protein CheW [Ideonella sp.]|nr:chemotaxis protein CheW [Ideonella sp.]